MRGSIIQPCPTLATPWTVAHQAPLSMKFSRQKYWCGLPFPPPGDLCNLGIKPASPVSPAFARRFFTAELPRKPWNEIIWLFFFPLEGSPEIEKDQLI